MCKKKNELLSGKINRSILTELQLHHGSIDFYAAVGVAHKPCAVASPTAELSSLYNEKEISSYHCSVTRATKFYLLLIVL